MAEHDLIDAPDAGAHAASNGDSDAAHVVIGGRKLSIEEVVAIAQHRAPVALNADPAWRARIQRGADFLRRHLAAGETVYGVNTGYGDAAWSTCRWNSSKLCRCNSRVITAAAWANISTTHRRSPSSPRV